MSGVYPDFLVACPRASNELSLLSQLVEPEVGDPEKDIPFRRNQAPALKGLKEGLFTKYFEAFLVSVIRTTCPLHHNEHFTILTILESLRNDEVSCYVVF